MVNFITPKQAQEWLNSGQAILIDVREADEFQSEHIPYALSLPLSSIDSDFATLNIPASRKIIFQCLKGARGEQACVLIKNKQGFDNEIYNIKGGITAWKEDGLPLIGKIKSTGMSIFRQVQVIMGAIISLLILLGFLGVGVAFLIAGILAFALFVAGITGWCGLAILLSKMPWNKK